MTTEGRQQEVELDDSFAGCVFYDATTKTRGGESGGRRTENTLDAGCWILGGWEGEGGGRRMGRRKLLFHLRLRQLGKTAALFAS